MSPEALHRKLEFIASHLEQLASYRKCSFDVYWKDHLKVDRLLELIITAGVDTIFHLLAVRGEPTPTSYSIGFLRAGEIGLLPNDLSRRLAQAAGLRNVLAHGYDDIDPHKVHASIDQAINDFLQFLELLKQY